MRGGSNYVVIRVHDGIGEALETTQVGNDLTFETDKFSTYAIAYTKADTPAPPTSTGGGGSGTPSNKQDIANATERSAWNPFLDVKEGDWFYEDVKYAYEKELMNGIKNDKFVPQGNMTRGMVTTVLYRMAGSPNLKTAVTLFPDVNYSEYYGNPIKWATENKIVCGYDSGLFESNKNVTREEFAKMLYLHAQLAGKDMSKIADSATLKSYSDSNKIKDWSVPSLSYMIGNGIIKGDKANCLNPQAQITRAETATMLSRFLNM